MPYQNINPEDDIWNKVKKSSTAGLHKKCMSSIRSYKFVFQDMNLLKAQQWLKLIQLLFKSFSAVLDPIANISCQNKTVYLATAETT